MSMYDFSETSHIEALKPEENWNVHKQDKNVAVNENAKIAPKGLPRETFQRMMRTWDDATVHLHH